MRLCTCIIQGEEALITIDTKYCIFFLEKLLGGFFLQKNIVNFLI